MRPASYVIVETSSGRAVWEIWQPELAAKINAATAAKYTAVPILEWLYKVNRDAKATR